MHRVPTILTFNLVENSDHTRGDPGGGVNEMEIMYLRAYMSLILRIKLRNLLILLLQAWF
jgi:hypothetical protein